jgi:FkbM family methyltransferase
MESQLDDLLSEGLSGAISREENEFDLRSAPFERVIVLFGARRMGRKTLAGLRRAGIEPVAFSDNNPVLWGQSIDGVPVLAPAVAARRFADSAVFVITIWGAGSADLMRHRERKLRDLGCQRVATFGPLFWKYSEIFLPDMPAMDLPHEVHKVTQAVRAGFEALADDRSRQEYIAQLRWRLRFDFDALPDPVADSIYFPADLVRLKQSEVFVDCGAYVGDTLLSFLEASQSRFDGVVAFEPDPASIAGLRRTVSCLPAETQGRIHVSESAVGASEGMVPFTSTGGLDSSVGSGAGAVPCTTLDRALEGLHPTYIKMDIEGAEPDALLGARQTIARHEPVLAVCSYHVQDHLWRIPALIHELHPDYRVFLRPHICLVEDLVCYAVPRSRLLQQSS